MATSPVVRGPFTSCDVSCAALVPVDVPLSPVQATETHPQATPLGWEQAAELLRANGREETDHGNRLLEAAAILEAQG